MKAHIVGSGIASLAAAAYLIRDGGMLGNNIYVYEAGERLGGAMGIAGASESGYILPTGRIFEQEYRCTFDLFSLVPSAYDKEKSIKGDLIEFNQRYGFYDKARVVDREGRIVKSRHFGLHVNHVLDLIKLAITPEILLDDKRISEFFPEDFFRTEFWFIWAAMMNSLPQHSAMEMRRWLHRFTHLLPDFSTMTQIYRTRFNQYDSIIEPIASWLRGQGVNFLTESLVTSIEFKPSIDEIIANSLEYLHTGSKTTVEVEPDSLVIVTNGSQTADLAVGSMAAPPKLRSEGRSWALWDRLARGRPQFGNPRAFFSGDHMPDTAWVTFTVTTKDPRFFEQMTAFTGSEPGRGGHLTLKDSNWFISLALFHQPEFIEQPADVMVWWGYALYPYAVGNFVAKPMIECNGAEILKEVVKHLRFDDELLGSSICIPCVLPYGGSVWLPRKRTDRPQVVPDGAKNFAFIGQFSEVPQDAAFTMEYAIRSGRTAVSKLLKLGIELPPVYQGEHDLPALYRALRALT